MIKRFALITLLTFVTIIKSNSQNHNISLRIEGIEYDSAMIAFMSVQNNDEEIEDTAIISNGELNYQFKATGLYYGVIVPFKLIHEYDGGDKFPLPSSRISFFINNGDIIKIDAVVKDKIVTYKSNGNNLSQQVGEFNNYLNSSGLYKDRIDFEHKFHKVSSSTWTKDEESQYWERRNANNKLYAEKIEKFVLNHPDYEYSPRLILEIKDKQKATTLYDKLTVDSKNSYFGQVLGSMIDGWAISTIGIKFPTFSGKTLSGENFDLTNYKGKYVLLDFWGSWCAPCINEIPKLKKLQSEFKDKLVVVGMVCNDTEDKVNRIIEKYKVDWVQLFDETNAFPNKYGIRAFPTKVLIDDKGFVVKTVDTTSDHLFEELRELLK